MITFKSQALFSTKHIHHKVKVALILAGCGKADGR